jgi:hypothetical protein
VAGSLERQVVVILLTYGKEPTTTDGEAAITRAALVPYRGNSSLSQEWSRGAGEMPF